jgi:hypothetical protein
MKLDDVLKYLGSGAVLYVAMAACAGESPPGGGSSTSDSGANNGGHDAVGVGDAVGDTVGIGDALTDPVPDAHAEDASGGTCGACTVSGNVRVIGADADPARMTSQSTSVAAPLKLVDGPFVLTDARPGFGTVRLWMSMGSTCSDTDPDVIATIISVASSTGTHAGTVYAPIHGARILIPFGRALCAGPSSSGTGSNRLFWAGFQPY